MSTYWDEESGSYKNFENEVVRLLEEILGSAGTEEQEPEVPVEDPELTDPETATGESGPTE